MEDRFAGAVSSASHKTGRLREEGSGAFRLPMRPFGRRIRVGRSAHDIDLTPKPNRQKHIGQRQSIAKGCIRGHGSIDGCDFRQSFQAVCHRETSPQRPQRPQSQDAQEQRCDHVPSCQCVSGSLKNTRHERQSRRNDSGDPGRGRSVGSSKEIDGSPKTSRAALAIRSVTVRFRSPVFPKAKRAWHGPQAAPVIVSLTEKGKPVVSNDGPVLARDTLDRLAACFERASKNPGWMRSRPGYCRRHLGPDRKSADAGFTASRHALRVSGRHPDPDRSSRPLTVFFKTVVRRALYAASAGPTRIDAS